MSGYAQNDYIVVRIDNSDPQLSRMTNKSTKVPLDIPTPDANKSVGHPSVAFHPNGFSGYKYWMAFTPYPGPARENPCIVCSNTGVDWIVPTGLTNPVFGLGFAGYGNNSDTHLIFSADKTKLIMYFRAVRSTSDEVIYYTTSTDGVHWTTPVVAVNVLGGNNQGIMSPAVEIEDDGTFSMWSINLNIADKRNRVEKRTSVDGITWSGPTACNVPNHNTGPYHVDVHKFAGVYYMLVLTATELKLRFLTSTDGVTWSYSSSVPLSGLDWDKNQQYRSAFLPVQGNPIKFDMWITGIKFGAGNAWDNDAQWRISYYKEFEINGNKGNGSPQLSFMRSGLYYGGLGSSTTILMYNGDAYAVPIYVPRKLSLSEIGLEVTTAGSVGSVIGLGIYADDGNGLPGGLILDAGTIDGTVVGFGKSTVSQSLEPGVYWLAAVSLGAPATRPTVRGYSDAILSIGLSNALDPAAACYRAGGQTSLPPTFSLSGTNAISPRILVKIL